MRATVGPAWNAMPGRARHAAVLERPDVAESAGAAGIAALIDRAGHAPAGVAGERDAGPSGTPRLIGVGERRAAVVG